MKKISVDREEALHLLELAVREARLSGYKPSSRHADFVERILTGPHLTFRYMLFTALLAKATNEEVNPLAVQVHAKIENAFDARSLCHKVIVPNQAAFFGSDLFRSNEPYLNKPARIPFLDESNPVRSGQDKKMLTELCRTLPSIKSKREAYKALRDGVFFLVRDADRKKEEMRSAVASVKASPAQVRSFLTSLLSESHHGETVVLVSGLLYWLLSKHRGEEWDIRVHPVNEPGSSSNQISDIDVYFEGALVHTSEVKDKAVVESDAHHAIRKAREAGCASLHLILGLSGLIKASTPAALEFFATNLGIQLSVFSIKALVESSAFWTSHSTSLEDVVNKILEFAEMARAKLGTKDFVLKVVRSLEMKTS